MKNRVQSIELAFHIMQEYMGEKIPTYRELQEETGASKNTVAKTVKFLEDKRIIINKVVENGIAII